MSYNLSVCVFIRNTFEGAFCLPESMAMLLPFADEFVVLDLSSTDGTLEVLEQIAAHNRKVRLLHGSFPYTDAGAFATLANSLIAMCANERVWFYQSDEILHEGLIPLVRQRFDAGKFDFSFWRVQLRENWQAVRWYPHLVHRVGPKDNFNFVGDGMTTDRTFAVDVCSDWDGGWFSKWGEIGKTEPEGIKPYVHQMLLDVSLLGAFRDAIPGRRALHSPFWHESDHVDGLPPDKWLERERQNPNWTKTTSPYNIPAIMRWHLGRTTYQLRPELLQSLKDNQTWEYVEQLEGWR